MNATARNGSRRIALFAETGGAGGAERMMVHLGDELLRRGHEVIPVLPTGRDPWMATQFVDRGCPPEMFTAKEGSADLHCLAQMVRILYRRKVDVVHTHEFFTSVYGGAAARLLRTPHVITMHGGRYYSSGAHRRAALRWSARGSRAVVGVSDATATELADQLGLARDRVQVVHNGVRPETGDRAPVRNELGVKDDELLVVAVGNLYPVKAHIVLLRALANMRANGAAPNWRVAIAGRGGEEPALRAFVSEHQLEDHVHILGYRSDIANILAASDVYAMPSLSEGLPMALIEAMFARRPVIASRTGGIPEVVTDGVDGLLVPPGDDAALADGLSRLFADAALRDRLATAGRGRAMDRFGVERMVDAYERLYGVAH
ncbi:MAG: glycosyl transferase group 1 [Gemmatimonadetes bacterium]|nr:glycosyl transferase group 1 [Gemmatimonadota bacterium]